ncbi:clathrin associated protein complex large subunit [Spiromyces aspiralis]|uniref:Clathrin associated protein complex large subunit n=1 Tax=Spiromyces aspiralis TaxID=68401 RepID=A0ACC1HLP5_9FUNG|nr:clathrin associated protein complex large subunit [Spiromyces aspiralis]
MIRLIAADCDQGLQWYAVLRAYHLLTKDIREEKMVLLGVWIIGEFGDFLVGEGLGDGANDAIGALGANGAILSDPDGQTLQPPAPLDVVKLLGRIESAPVATNTIRHFVAVALAKLTSRYATHPTAIREVARLIGGMSDDLDAETQTRAVEFEALMRPALDAVREGVVDRMPAPEYSEEKFDADTLNPAAVRMRDLAMLGTPRNIVDSSVFSREETSRQQQKSKSIVADLLGLMGDEDIGTQRQQQQSDALMGSTSPPGGGGAAAASVGSPSQAGSHRQQPQQEQQRYSVNTLLDLVGSTSISTPANNGGVAKPSTAPRDGFGTDYEVSNSNGVAVTFCPVKDHPESDVVKVDVKLINTTSNATISNLAFHAAVLKTQRLTIRPPSGHEMRPNEQVTQSMEVSNPNRTPVRFLVKLSYDHSELGHQEAMIKFSGFPATVL